MLLVWDIYEDFCKAAGTYTEYERTFVTGYNRRLAAKTGAVTRAQNKFKNAQITLTNFNESDTMEERVKSFKALLLGHGINLTIKARSSLITYWVLMNGENGLLKI